MSGEGTGRHDKVFAILKSDVFPELLPDEPQPAPKRRFRKTSTKARHATRFRRVRPVRALLRLFGAILHAGAVTAVLTLGILLFLFARDLPDHAALTRYAPPLVTQIRSETGAVLDEFATERRIYMPAAEIPDLVVQAFISAEDKNFFRHNGLDLRAMGHAAVDAVRSNGETLRGASTITQQVMKNFLLSDMPLVERKLKELILAHRIERVLGKEKILELYLNEIFLGQGAFGVAAAAQAYFNKPLDALLPREAALLASLPKSPSELHPVRNMTRLRARRNYVLEEMYENGYLTRAAYEAEAWEPIETVQGGDFPDYLSSLPPRDYFTDEIRRQITATRGQEAFFSGGLQIRATVDEGMQAIAARALRRGLERYDRRQGIWRPTGLSVETALLSDETAWRAALGAAEIARDIELDGWWYPAVVLETRDGMARIGVEDIEDTDVGHWVRSTESTWTRRQEPDGTSGRWVSSAADLLRPGEIIHVRPMPGPDGVIRGWSLRQIPEIQGGFAAMDVRTGRVIAIQGGFSYQHSVFNRASQAMRQPGSTFKAVVFAAALDHGYGPDTPVLDGPVRVEMPGGEVWTPANASHDYLGMVPLRVGLERSRNLMTVRLADELGLGTVARYAERLGVYDRMEPYLANALGAQETTLLDMVAAYAAVANGGRKVEPTLVSEVLDREGRALFRLEDTVCPYCDAGAKPPAIGDGRLARGARVLNAVTAHQLTGMLRGVVERGTAAGAIRLPVPVAGKTGTTNDARDVWFVGFTSTIAAGCYMGFDTPRPLGPGAFGGTMCAPVFQDFMAEAVRQYGGEEFPVPAQDDFDDRARLVLSRDAPVPNALTANLSQETETTRLPDPRDFTRPPDAIFRSRPNSGQVVVFPGSPGRWERRSSSGAILVMP